MDTLTDYKRDSFVFYRSFFEAIKLLDSQQAMTLVTAISEYALNGIEPQIDGVAGIVWTTIKPQLEANRRKYECGKKGGAPKGNRNNPNGRRGKHVTEAPTNETMLESPPIQTQQAIPTFNEIEQYVRINNLQVNPEYFHTHYQSVGWKSGPNAISDWRALIRKWHLKEVEKHSINNQAQNAGLGIGEFLKDGYRTYGTGGAHVPSEAPPRPGNGYWWNTITQSWDNAI